MLLLALAFALTGGLETSSIANVVIPEPVEDEALDMGPAVRIIDADADGRATVFGLLPGTNRVTAYPPDSLWGDNPQLKQQLREGKKVQAAANQVTLVEVSVRSGGIWAVSSW